MLMWLQRIRKPKKIAWDYLKTLSQKIPGTKFNETELRADFMNGARIMLLSSENPDSIRGVYLDGAVMDEAAQINAAVIDEVITSSFIRSKRFFIGGRNTKRNE
jgi:phage terminase large subunit